MMSEQNTSFKPTEDWPLQENYKRDLHQKIQRWGERVAPSLEALPAEEQQPRERLLGHLVTSVERGDKVTACLVNSLDGYVSMYFLDGPYGGGGSIDSPAGHSMCQFEFEGLYAIFEAGRFGALDA